MTPPDAGWEQGFKGHRSWGLVIGMLLLMTAPCPPPSP